MHHAQRNSASHHAVSLRGRSCTTRGAVLLRTHCSTTPQYEEYCENYECNIATATEDQLTCPSPTPAKKDDKKDEVDALLVGAAIAIGVAVLAMGMAIKLRLDNRSLQAKFSAFMEGGGAAGKPGRRV